MQSFLNNPDLNNLAPALVEELQRSVVTKRVVKGQQLLRKGEKVQEHYFVKSGLLRSYMLDDKGREHIYMFAPAGWLIGDVGAHLYDKEAYLYIVAIEDSVVEVLSNSLLLRIDLRGVDAVMKLNRRVYMLQKRIMLLLSASLQERYLDFVATYPDIVQRVPQKMIASYLGVTPEGLSKVRSDLTKSG